MGTRRVRTSAGVQRFDKPIGAIIGRTSGGVLKARATDRALEVQSRRKGRTRRAHSRTVGDLAEIRAIYQPGVDTLESASGAVRDKIQYHSPKKISESKRARGQNLKPRKEALETARGRRGSGQAQREVAYNPLAGRLVALRGGGDGSRQVTRASAARAKARKAPKVTEYVGRRRAKD